MAKKFVIGYLSLFEGELKIEFVEADSDVEAALDFLKITDPGLRVSLPSMEEVDSYAYDLDSYITVKELPN